MSSIGVRLPAIQRLVGAIGGTIGLICAFYFQSRIDNLGAALVGTIHRGILRGGTGGSHATYPHQTRNDEHIQENFKRLFHNVAIISHPCVFQRVVSLSNNVRHCFLCYKETKNNSYRQIFVLLQLKKNTQLHVAQYGFEDL